MTSFARIISGLSSFLIIGLIIFGGGGTERGTILAAESRLATMREQIESRFRVEDEEDLHWKLITDEGSVGSDGHRMFQHGGKRNASLTIGALEYADQGQYDQAIAEFTKCHPETVQICQGLLQSGHSLCPPGAAGSRHR